MSDTAWEAVFVVVGGIVIIGCLVLAVLQPKFEAEAYSRLTGKSVTYWDAVWLDLRIQEQVKP